MKNNKSELELEFMEETKNDGKYHNNQTYVEYMEDYIQWLESDLRAANYRIYDLEQMI